MSPKEAARETIKALVEKFDSQIENYKASSYNETLTRRDFIDPFFEALGWDISNRAGAWEAYREVIHEDKIKIGGVSKAPDYSFRLLGGQRLFFVEAKKPSVHIKDDIAPAYQVRLYGWNAKLAISVVTDFEEFAIYDCSKKPKPNDKPSTARLDYFKYDSYLDKFDFIWDTFSREQVIKGGLIKFQRAEKKGTATVDKEFLNSLDEWRKLLAANISKNNPDISEDDLNYAVQQTIDRIIFLRIAEDRGLEPYGQLRSATRHENYYKDLFLQFNQADNKYNSGLFHFKKEKDNPSPEDKITGKLVVDNKAIKSIINSLYPPESDFLFNVLPVEILGSAYEQFLGKQIVISKGGKATIEEKPEVRKAGGVYYTPQYIVDYIVEHTVGKLVEGKTPAQVSKLRIVDPACGSGSFLLGAYQYLLNWHVEYYREKKADPAKKNAPINKDGSLTTAEKKRILVNNLFGVDLDKNAVEVTKLSLLLKCMEGETMQTVNDQMALLHERVLPSLENNIKSGNSLIDLDYYDNELDFGEEKKIKPFSWEKNFPEVFKQGGFDVVIGNPPYVLLQTLETRYAFSYASKKFSSAKYKIDTYQLFIEKGIIILRENGLLGYITPNTFLKNVHAEPLRKLILDETIIRLLTLFYFSVFNDASVDTCIIILSKSSKQKRHSETVVKASKQPMTYETKQVLNQLSFKDNVRHDFNLTVSSIEKELMKKIEKTGITVGSYCTAYFGIQTYDRKTYVSPTAKSKSYKPVIDGTNIETYRLKQPIEYVNFIPSAIKSGGKADVYTQDRIGVRQIGSYPIATIVPKEIYTLNTVYNIYPKDNSEINLYYILSIVNSSVTKFYWGKRNADEKKTFPKIKKEALISIPLPMPNKSQEQTLASFVLEMIKLKQKVITTQINSEINQLEQRITYSNEKINKLVYELYNLTEEEIKIIEGT